MIDMIQSIMLMFGAIALLRLGIEIRVLYTCNRAMFEIMGRKENKE